MAVPASSGWQLTGSGLNGTIPANRVRFIATCAFLRKVCPHEPTRFPDVSASSLIGVTGGLPASGSARYRVIVMGAGIGGLCCASELVKLGHDVTVLEASGRTGGHVRTIRDPFKDGLYADGGAEHITRPDYELFW